VRITSLANKADENKPILERMECAAPLHENALNGPVPLYRRSEAAHRAGPTP
jgi:hypothetical protein